MLTCGRVEAALPVEPNQGPEGAEAAEAAASCFGLKLPAWVKLRREGAAAFY